MKEHRRNAILVLALTLVVFTPVLGVPAADGEQHSGTGKPKEIVVDLTGPIEPNPGSASAPGFSMTGIPGEKPVDNSLPVLLKVDSVENKAGKHIFKIHLVNQGQQPLNIPISLSHAASTEAQQGSTSFLFSIVLSVPGSSESFSHALVSSSDSDPKHSRVILPPRGEATILLPLPARIFRAKDVKAAPQLEVRASLSELKIKEHEYITKSVRKAQSVNAVTLSAKEVSELAKGNNE